MKTLSYTVVNKASICLFIAGLIDIYANLVNNAVFGLSFLVEFYSYVIWVRSEQGGEAARSLAMVF